MIGVADQDLVDMEDVEMTDFSHNPVYVYNKNGLVQMVYYFPVFFGLEGERTLTSNAVRLDSIAKLFRNSLPDKIMVENLC
jgi:hypothetical protein